MTIKELYELCKEEEALDFKIQVAQISVNGCFTGYQELDEDMIDIGYGEQIVSLG